MERKILKVKLLAGPIEHIYPNFSSMDAVKNAGYVRINGEPVNGPFGRYINLYGTWFYDRKRKVHHDSTYSPHGTYWAVLLVPADFVAEAVAKFGSVCAELTEAEAATFYENRVTHNDPAQIVDTNILLGIKTKNDLGVTLTQEDTDAKDPTKATPGVKTNNRKTFAGLLTEMNITVKV